MPELHQGPAQFYKYFWGGEEREFVNDRIEPKGKSGPAQSHGIDLTVDFGSTRDYNFGFWDTVIIEWQPTQAQKEAVTGAGLNPWPPQHPRANYTWNQGIPFKDARIWEKYVTYGLIDRDDNPKQNVAQQAWLDFKYTRGIDVTMTPKSHYTCLPLQRGGPKRGQWFWIDLTKPIRAIYFPLRFEESPLYSKYGVYAKLSLCQLPTDHQIVPDVIASKDIKALEYSKKGLWSWEQTLLVDVYKYMALIALEPKNRAVDPNTAVTYCNAWDIQGQGPQMYGTYHYVVDEWERITIPWDAVQTHEQGQKVETKNPSNVDYLARSLQVGSAFISLIPLVGPVVSGGLDCAADVMEKNQPPDLSKVFDVNKDVIKALPEVTKYDLLSKVISLGKDLWKLARKW